jgi:hypothetical protein
MIPTIRVDDAAIETHSLQMKVTEPMPSRDVIVTPAYDIVIVEVIV